MAEIRISTKDTPGPTFLWPAWSPRRVYSLRPCLPAGRGLCGASGHSVIFQKATFPCLGTRAVPLAHDKCHKPPGHSSRRGFSPGEDIRPERLSAWRGCSPGEDSLGLGPFGPSASAVPNRISGVGRCLSIYDCFLRTNENRGIEK